MNYIELTFKIQPKEPTAEILIAELAELGFESFVEEEDGLKAYIQKDLYEDRMFTYLDVFLNDDVEISYSIMEIEDQNWNAKWESEYEPVLVENRCYIRAPFHEHKPEIEYEIEIEPQMSFGTAHHETTYQMIQLLMDEDVTNAKVLDMGSGTAVLAILAAIKGAAAVDAIDIDEWAYNNALQNTERNQVTTVNVMMGGAELLVNQSYDLVLANINKNILLRDMEHYVAVMHSGSKIFFSGFYTEDLSDIEAQAKKLGMKYIRHLVRNNWVAAEFVLV